MVYITETTRVVIVVVIIEVFRPPLCHKEKLLQLLPFRYHDFSWTESPLTHVQTQLRYEFLAENGFEYLVTFDDLTELLLQQLLSDFLRTGIQNLSA